MKTIPYPIKGLTKSQREVFEQVASGNYALECYAQRQAAIKKLLEIGAIVPCGKKLICKDRFGEVWMQEYWVPIPLHAAWCKWCSETVTDEELENT